MCYELKKLGIHKIRGSNKLAYIIVDNTTNRYLLDKESTESLMDKINIRMVTICSALDVLKKNTENIVYLESCSQSDLLKVAFNEKCIHILNSDKTEIERLARNFRLRV